MDDLNLKGTRPPRGAGRWREFWRRRFGDAGTPPRYDSDVALGIVIPVLCFILDPAVFRGPLLGEGVLQPLQFFAYAVSAVEMVTLCLWLWLGRRLGEWSWAAGGILLAGGVFSAAVGLIILPLSLIGLVLLVGALGFIPFLTSVVYLRNGLRALRSRPTQLPGRAGVFAALAFGLVFALGVPGAAQWGLTRAASAAADEVLEGRELSPVAKQVIRWTSPAAGTSYDRIVWTYRGEADPSRRARLAAAYREITGREIERRLAVLMD